MGERRQAPNLYTMEISKPVVAAINGHCLAGGLGLALLCDVRLASPNATFGCMGTARGIIPGGGQTQRLPRVVGLGPAMWLLLSAERIDAQDALRIGLLNIVVPQEQLIEKAREWADLLASRAPLAIKATKKATLASLDHPLEEGLKLEAELGRGVMKTEDAAEGVRAFNERRTAVFHGR
jgi:enoyl-CoA hydratase/carnithine racemase